MLVDFSIGNNNVKHYSHCYRILQTLILSRMDLPKNRSLALRMTFVDKHFFNVLFVSFLNLYVGSTNAVLLIVVVPLDA